MEWSLHTARLHIFPATTKKEHVEFLYRIWTNPQVMRNVGFPDGLQISRSKIREQLAGISSSEFNRVLLVARLTDQKIIGECKLGRPDGDQIAHTDVKLWPSFWRNGYGTEIKRALVAYLFEHTDCVGIRATPNQGNLASIRMQEAVGGILTSSGTHRFPAHMRSYTCDVPYFEYTVYRSSSIRDFKGSG